MRLALLAAVALAGCSANAASDVDKDGAALNKALAGRVAGEPKNCISVTSNDGPMIIGNTLLYRDGRRLWRTEPVGRCPGLDDDPILVVELHGSQLCRNDRFRTLDRTSTLIPGPYCRFGEFTPYEKPR